jgi:hypothetical protein
LVLYDSLALALEGCVTTEQQLATDDQQCHSYGFPLDAARFGGLDESLARARLKGTTIE